MRRKGNEREAGGEWDENKMKSRSTIILQTSTRARTDDCHSEESRLYRDDEESKSEILRCAQNDRLVALSLCGGGEMRGKMAKDGMRVK
jgi:hypothetical protein